MGCALTGSAAQNGGSGKTPAGWTFACAAENDLYRVLAASRLACPRFATAGEAVRAAAEGSAVLILADGYPDKPTAVEPAVFDEAARKRLRLYVEYPERLPDMEVGAPKDVKYERGVVTSDVFGPSLAPRRIVLVSGCRYLPVKVAKSHLVAAKVAGVDSAVFGFQDTATEPLLFDHPCGNLLVGTTKLSHFVSGRYLPTEAWRTIWETILTRLQPDGAAWEPWGRFPSLPSDSEAGRGRQVRKPAALQLRWTPTVRPRFGPDEPLPADAETQALRRSADWIVASRSLRHADWPKETLNLSLTYNTVRDMPRPDWPVGDGSAGVLEGYSSTIRRDGSQPMRYAVRNDCTSEVAMLLATDAAVNGRPENARRAANLLDYIFDRSGLAAGPRADPQSPSYGLVGWALDHPGSYWGDDNARALLAVGAVAATAGERRWDEAVARAILANFRTTGVRGFRPSCVEEKGLQAQGWKPYWTSRHVHYSPHMQSWIWACNFWAYQQTRFEPLLARSKTGMRLMMQAYPARWDWILRSGTIERSRLLLPLAWLVRVDDTPEHRRWLRQIAEDLLALQDRSGALREVIGDGGPGIPSNASYGTCETSLIQTDGDPVCDMLYSCNFALIGLHEAAATTGDPLYAEAEERLARFLCHIQVRSEAHPELDGAWYRAFDFRRWDYWASSADWEWGPWCTETGWCQPWIASTLALRRQKTSLWDLVQKVDLKTHFDRLRPQMLPDEDLAGAKPATVSHAARGKPVRLTTLPDARYPGVGETALTDGEVSVADYQAGEWLGFEGPDLEAVIDLGTPTEIRTVATRCLQATGVGIYLPSQVEVALSQDGKQFQPAAEARSDVSPKEPGPLVHNVRVEVKPQLARYLRVRAVNVGVIPTGHPAAGRKAWLFVDEILVNP
jgi:hypothetical protein